MLIFFDTGKPGYFEDVTEKAGLHRTIEPTVDADRLEGGVDVRYYGVFNTGLFRDILPGPYRLTAMFTDLDNDGTLRGKICTLVEQLEYLKTFQESNQTNKQKERQTDDD